MLTPNIGSAHRYDTERFEGVLRGGEGGKGEGGVGVGMLVARAVVSTMTATCFYTNSVCCAPFSGSIRHPLCDLELRRFHQPKHPKTPYYRHRATSARHITNTVSKVTLNASP